MCLALRSYEDGGIIFPFLQMRNELSLDQASACCWDSAQGSWRWGFPSSRLLLKG